jgi:hypothetical protein
MIISLPFWHLWTYLAPFPKRSHRHNHLLSRDRGRHGGRHLSQLCLLRAEFLDMFLSQSYSFLEGPLQVMVRKYMSRRSKFRSLRRRRIISHCRKACRFLRRRMVDGYSDLVLLRTTKTETSALVSAYADYSRKADPLSCQYAPSPSMYDEVLNND